MGKERERKEQGTDICVPVPEPGNGNPKWRWHAMAYSMLHMVIIKPQLIKDFSSPLKLQMKVLKIFLCNSKITAFFSRGTKNRPLGHQNRQKKNWERKERNGNGNRKFVPEQKEREPKLKKRSGTGNAFSVPFRSLLISACAGLCQKLIIKWDLDSLAPPRYNSDNSELNRRKILLS